MRDVFRLWNEYFQTAAIKHITWNWSGSEQAIRHPKLPVGLTCRDQGQLDLYAGNTRIILNMEGNLLNIASRYAIVADQIALNSSDIKSIFIQGKHFNEDIHNEQMIVAQKRDLKDYWIIGAETRVDPNTGEFIALVPLGDVLEAKHLFEEIEDEDTPANVEIYRLVNSLLGVP